MQSERKGATGVYSARIYSFDIRGIFESPPSLRYDCSSHVAKSLRRIQEISTTKLIVVSLDCAPENAYVGLGVPLLSTVCFQSISWSGIIMARWNDENGALFSL